MAGYRGHIGGALLFCGLLYFFPFWNPLPVWGKAACVGIAVLFALWPDVDVKSKGQTIYILAFLIIDAILIYRQEYKRAAYLGFLIVLPIVSPHRGWTHSFIAMILIPGAIYLAVIKYTEGTPKDYLPYFLAALFGYASHLLLDRIPLFNRKRNRR